MKIRQKIKLYWLKSIRMQLKMELRNVPILKRQDIKNHDKFTNSTSPLSSAVQSVDHLPVSVRTKVKLRESTSAACKLQNITICLAEVLISTNSNALYQSLSVRLNANKGFWIVSKYHFETLTNLHTKSELLLEGVWGGGIFPPPPFRNFKVPNKYT